MGGSQADMRCAWLSILASIERSTSLPMTVANRGPRKKSEISVRVSVPWSGFLVEASLCSCFCAHLALSLLV